MSSKTILACPTCKQRLNVPTNRGELRLTCPKCRTNWLWTPKNSRSIGRFEVRPKTLRNAVLLGALCAIFCIVGLGLIFSGANIPVGLLALLIFGGAGVYAIPKLLRRKVSMVLSADGIELRYPQGSAFVPWADVEQIGTARISTTKMVGIRLRSYDRYLNDMSPDLAAFMVESLPYLMVKGALLLEVPGGVGLWLKAEGKSLESFGDVGNLAQALMWARENYGYDLAFSWAELDRPPNKFVGLLEEYRCRV